MDAFYSLSKPRIQEYCGLRSDESSGLDCEFLVARGAGEPPFRFIRYVGSYHQKSGQPYATLIRREANRVEHPLEDLLSVYGWPLRAAKRICSNPARIPSAGHGLQDLMDQYLASELRRRHTAFDISQPSSGDLENDRKLLQGFQDHELAEDRGLKRAVQLGRCKGLPSRSIGMAVAERYRQAAWDSPIMAWHTESHDGYNPTSRALFWSRLYAS